MEAVELPCLIEELSLPYAELDAIGRVICLNQALRELNGPGAPDPVGHLAWEWMPPSEWDRACSEYMSHMMSGEEPRPARRTLFTRTGEFRTFDTYRNLIRDGDGAPTGMRVLFVDVTETTRAEEEALRRLRHLECVLAALPDALLVTDSLGSIGYANPAAERLTGWSMDELRGRGFDTMPLIEVHRVEVGSVGFQGAMDSGSQFEATIADRNGERMRVEIRTTPLTDPGSSVTTGVVVMIRRLSAAK